ncbi:MAG: PilZ domain-containing protein [Deltaproteobacteria bacterium]|nr:PilZ domain-containing protein [Deltaproteobacteria bacterium]
MVEVKKIFVGKSNMAMILCPGCGAAKSVNVEKFRGQQKTLSVRCKKCDKNFSILLDFRASVRKDVQLSGYYKKFGGEEWRKVEIKDLSHTSRTGIRIAGTHDLKKGDDITIKFTLNNTNHSEIERTAVVRWATDKEAGLGVTDNVPYESNLGFYLRSLP